MWFGLQEFLCLAGADSPAEMHSTAPAGILLIYYWRMYSLALQMASGFGIQAVAS